MLHFLTARKKSDSSGRKSLSSSFCSQVDCMWYCKYLKAAGVGCHSGSDQNVIKRNDETKGCNLLLLKVNYVNVYFE